MKILISLSLVLLSLFSQVHSASVRVAHACPDAPAAGVDVLVDGIHVPEFSNLTFQRVSNYLFEAAGNHIIEIVPSGFNTPVLANTTLNVDLLTPITIAVADKVANMRALIFTDDLKKPETGTAALRFVHLALNTPPLDIAITNGPTLFTNIPYKSATAYTPINLGIYSLLIKVSGETNVVLTPSIAVEDGKIYSIYAEGIASGTPPLKAVVSNDL